MSVVGPGCVKTSTSRERAELFSLFAFLDGARQRCSFLIQLIRGKRSTRKSDFGVFTQPGSNAPFWPSADDFRGRDASYLAPPAQIRTGPIRAHGSHLGYVTARRDILTKFRMRFSACDTVSRYCARPVLC